MSGFISEAGHQAAPQTDGSAAAARQLLRFSGISWFVVALAGQWLFAFYIGLLYLWPVLRGDYLAANQARPITGFVAGDLSGNLVLFAHLLPAAILSIGGLLQLVPQLRQRWPRVHRWNGRLFLTLGLCGALTGLYLTWVRGSRLSDLGAIGITINGLLIPIAVSLAWYYARARNFKAHQRFALHSFFLINGVWTFRLYLMGWYLLNQGPNGNNKTLDGPADLIMSFACYALPMLVAEIWWRCRHSQDTRLLWTAGLLLSCGCIVTLLGVVAAAMMMWGPRISAVW